jgi:hypothetical protein
MCAKAASEAELQYSASLARLERFLKKQKEMIALLHEAGALQPQRGMLVLFPSSTPHAVAEVTDGCRYTMALWFTRDAAHDEDRRLLGSGRLFAADAAPVLSPAVLGDTTRLAEWLAAVAPPEAMFGQPDSRLLALAALGVPPGTDVSASLRRALFAEWRGCTDDAAFEAYEKVGRAAVAKLLPRWRACHALVCEEELCYFV